ncbi:nucleotidyl transferase AbiEii/AbiGii toxin family protein [Hahella ganghwensis]|uniref:nucleotidyl transferase AbiEii/AbiGii toxin family protein n=1 Tax=Hahella ganghwensis TaxID=286420 RepID=UPI000366EEAD|nr:nucleotidyl transferase AbiEii/AbiGii toxin family protein [Hahella ganghwensis]
MNYNLNIEQIKTVALALKDLKDEVVFVGGSTTALLVDSPSLGKARQTEDVDFIVDIALKTELNKFEVRMRELGFRNDTSPGAPLCRWLIGFGGKYLKVDAMPVDESVLGFSNQWYKDAIETANLFELDQGLSIKVVSPIYFLGTKFEAFKGRGNGDIFSHDLEDVFYVLEHRTGIDLEVYEAGERVKSYLKSEFTNLLDHPDLDNHLPGMLDHPDSAEGVVAKMVFISEKC